MVQKAIVLDLCDLCQHDEHATVVMVAQINGTEYKLDLCNDHATRTRVKDIASLSRSGGPSTGGIKPRANCSICGKQFSVGTGMTRHMTITHKSVVTNVAV